MFSTFFSVPDFLFVCFHIFSYSSDKARCAGGSLHTPGQATRQGSHCKSRSVCSDFETSRVWQNIRENHFHCHVCSSLVKFPVQPDSSKMCSWPPGSQNYLRWGLWCKFSGRFLMGIKLKISHAPKAHLETLAWCVRLSGFSWIFCVSVNFSHVLNIFLCPWLSSFALLHFLVLHSQGPVR